MPSAGYAQIATTVTQLKAITAANRANNFTLLLPATGSWYYYHATSTDNPDNLTVIQPNDGVGRWIAVSLQVILAAAASAIASHQGNSLAHPQYQTAAQVAEVAASAAGGAISSHESSPNPHSQYQTSDQVTTTATAAASGAVSSHEANSLNPHPQYQRTDGVYIASQPNTASPAFTAKVATGGSSTGGFQVVTEANNPAVALGADNRNRGVITAGSNGLVIGGSPTERVTFWGGNAGNGTTRPNAIALAGNNTADTRRAANDVIAVLRAVGLIAQ